MRFFGITARCLLFATAAFAANAAPTPFQLADLKRLVSLHDVRISPDGTQVAVVVSTPDWKTDKPQLEIDLVDVASGARRALTWKRTGLAIPKWSPDGTRLAFLADDVVPADEAEGAEADAKADAADAAGAGGEKVPQLFVMPMNGGDPVRLTSAKHGVSEFAWSPDGARLAFVAADEAPNAKAIKEHDDAFRVTDNHFLTRAALTPSHLWVVPSTGGKSVRLTQGTFSLATDQSGGSAPEWNAAGTRIAFTRFPGPYWGPSFHSVIASVDAAGGAVDTLVADESSTGPLFAPGAETLGFMRPRNGDRSNGYAVYVRAQGTVRDATRALARHLHTFAWLPGGRSLLLEGPLNTRSVFWEQPLDGAARTLDLGDVEPTPDVAVSTNGVIAFVGNTATHPNELFVMDGVDAKPRRLTNLNAFVDGLALGRVEPIEWRGPDGFREDGVLTYPVGYQKEGRYPLVLVIHGGPESASLVNFAPLPQLLAAAGFVVFQPNYRGSINRGDAYQHAIYRDTGAGPDRDVMAGLAAVLQLGIVDPGRIGVSGWSYGGYMTTWLTGHHSLWKAAVAGAALTDWVMDYTVAFYQEGDQYFFGGSPWDPKYQAIWREQSPIRYARNVKAPTLIMGDVGDPNVPLTNSYEWFHALRDAGVETEFYAYPVDSHFPGDVVRTTDVYRRWVEWMTKRLAPGAGASR
jgi:dipeptidyl aminopeptidase/acylaminoacyl peptidase